MKIIPLHHQKAEKVKSWSSIKKEAQEILDMMLEGDFTGHYQKAYAVSQAQVSDKPLSYFVLNNTYKDLVKMFGHWCIINLKIKTKSQPVYWKEACMSFPWREPKNVDRFNIVKVKYRVPFLWFTRPMTKTFTGLSAFICQHEFEHSMGINIYGKSK